MRYLPRLARRVALVCGQGRVQDILAERSKFVQERMAVGFALVLRVIRRLLVHMCRGILMAR